MPDFNIAAKSKEEQDKVNVDLAASGVAYKERLNMPVIAEQVAHLRDYFLERLNFYREASITLPKPSDPRYIEMADQNSLLGGGSGK
ncbi:DNA polymerase III subunit theta [Citrobacter portucalensis]|uniref:DNA polymerase III subunit theta n=1 Tax=Citrobacter portucalensis TaxID=1639133 RepID=UPI0008FD46BD|nr:DNA polymerase III subunit theta [Citrobacter portucalensis]OIY03352.1 DNA polymerase III subunit theta [Citrobacter portucalensis]UQQ22852.1 DNA polymerase III subunit theta [Citrobacter portucalensis]